MEHGTANFQLPHASHIFKQFKGQINLEPLEKGGKKRNATLSEDHINTFFKVLKRVRQNQK